MSILPLSLLLLTPAQGPLAYLDASIEPMITATLELRPGGHAIRTGGLSAGSDTVLHVRLPNGNILTNDNSGSNKASSISLFVFSTMEVEVFVRAKYHSTGGTCDLLLNSAVLPGYADRRFGLSAFSVQPGHHRYEAVTSPESDAFADLSMLAVDCSTGDVVLVDTDGGTGVMPAIDGSSVCGLYVGHNLEDVDVFAHVYTNDVLLQDGDGDGLGPALEAALGTCDNLNIPSWPSYCNNLFTSGDSDVDGINDGMEVLGFDHSEAPQYFPFYGADPLHKDVFVEVDYETAAIAGMLAGTKVLWTEADLVNMSAHYLDGTAAELDNPDGMPGIHLHIDNGLTPSDPANRTLFGNWGGLNFVDVKYDSAAALEEMHDARWESGWRWGLYTEGGAGQAAWTLRRFSFGGVGAFTHELGHALTLAHGGTEAFNCKPNYHSLMNYAYGLDAGFSHGTNPPLDPSRVNEGLGLQMVKGEQDALDRYSWQPLGAGVDISSNGSIESALIRAPLTLATDQSCDMATAGSIELATGEDFGDASPQLVEHNGWIYALWTDQHQKLVTRRAPHSGNDARGGCPDSGNVSDQTACTTFLPARSHPITGIVGMDASVVSVPTRGGSMDYLVLAIRDAQTNLKMRYIRILSDGSLASSWDLVALPAYIQIESDPELAEITAANGTRQPVVIYSPTKENGTVSAYQNKYAWSTVNLNASTPWVGNTVPMIVDGTSHAIPGKQHISTAEYIDGGTKILCGVFPNAAQRVKFYCYQPSTATWVSKDDGIANGGSLAANARPSLAYFRSRTSGGAIATGQGRFWYQYSLFGNPDLPRVRFSTAMGPGVDPLADAVLPDLGHHGYFEGKWTHLRGNASVDLLGSPNMSAMKAITLTKRDNKPDLLRFHPFANGTYEKTMRDNNDFERMRWGICASAVDSPIDSNIDPAVEIFCGPKPQ